MNTIKLRAIPGQPFTTEKVVADCVICVTLLLLTAGCSSRASQESAVKENLATVPASLTTPELTPIDGSRTEAMAIAVANMQGQVETNVDLSFTGVTDDDLARIEFPDTVRQINLSNTRITDRGVEYLGRLRNLETLLLMNTSVSEAVVDHLKRMPSLCEVRLDNTQVSGPAQMELVHYFTPRVNARMQRQTTRSRQNP